MLGLPAGAESCPERDEAGSVRSTPQAVMVNKRAAATRPRDLDELLDTIVAPPAMGQFSNCLVTLYIPTFVLIGS
jgi:hypothetical protein